MDGIAQNLKAHGDTNAKAGVGVAHFVPGAQTINGDNYNYGSAPAVASTADDFMYNFPNLTAENRSIGPSDGSPTRAGVTTHAGSSFGCSTARHASPVDPIQPTRP